MSEKWTPGPWSVGSDDFFSQCTPIKADGYCVGSVEWRQENPNDESAANAKLIAAAPDLAEALKAVYLWAKAFGDSGDGGFWDFDDCPEGKQARAALTRAGAVG